MKRRPNWSCVFITLLYSLTFNTAADKSLILVQILHRHGERNPMVIFPPNASLFPEGPMEITMRGRQQMYQLGIYFQEKYTNFIREYNSEEVFAVSSDTNRTKDSLRCCLAGFFHKPFKDGLCMTGDILTVIPEDVDFYLLQNCDALRNEIYKLINTNVKELMVHHSHLFHGVNQFLDVNVTEHPEYVSVIYDVLNIMTVRNFSVPNWTKIFFPEPLTSLIISMYAQCETSQEVKSLSGGPFISYMVRNMEAKAKGTMKPPERKLFLFSGHDTTIASVLCSLGLFPHTLPGYGASFIAELYKEESNQDTVEFYYVKEVGEEAIELNIPNCTSPCYLTKFMEIVEDILPHDIKMKCKEESAIAAE